MQELLTRIKNFKSPVLLAFDVDGTLTEVTEDPNQTTVSHRVVKQLRRLEQSKNLEVALITGRDERALRRMIDFSGLWVSVEHGGTVFHPDGQRERQECSSQQQHVLKEYWQWAEHTLKPLGADLEEKRTAVGVHVRRLAMNDLPSAQIILERAEEKALALELHPRGGRKMLEADVFRHDKGEALLRIYKETAANGVVYFGDDLTDFPALEKAESLGGLGVFVRSIERPHGPGSMVLQSVSELHHLLEQL